jgi:hypothetical protein
MALGVLNNEDVHVQISPGLDYSSKAPGRFKKVRPARRFFSTDPCMRDGDRKEIRKGEESVALRKGKMGGN